MGQEILEWLEGSWWGGAGVLVSILVTIAAAWYWGTATARLWISWGPSRECDDLDHWAFDDAQPEQRVFEITLHNVGRVDITGDHFIGSAPMVLQSQWAEALGVPLRKGIPDLEGLGLTRSAELDSEPEPKSQPLLVRVMQVLRSESEAERRDRKAPSGALLVYPRLIKAGAKITLHVQWSRNPHKITASDLQNARVAVREARWLSRAAAKTAVLAILFVGGSTLLAGIVEDLPVTYAAAMISLALVWKTIADAIDGFPRSPYERAGLRTALRRRPWQTLRELGSWRTFGPDGSRQHIRAVERG
ncbi:hypothetical protein [Myceligenerans indicum]|uniref:DUF2207 domain-containing protein n=1 Tax=Myceligenerans indicum TaxID=2593663 RepID=A0ABS1LT02_9MICO|nr:hypothetical protein [Myceligenerans indicum]MBL0888933.1 hypothetical protein [Myceligenerans indicum]